MDHTGVTPAVAISAPDLADVLLARGPFLTAYLTTEPGVENAAQRSQLRWKDLRRELAEQGADDGALAAVDPLVVDAHHEGACLAVVATPDGVMHAEHEPEPPVRDVGRWAPLPAVGPMLEWRQSELTYVAVLVDRTGGDLFLFRADAPDQHEEVRGGEYPIHRARSGGWSHRRYQQRAE